MRTKLRAGLVAAAALGSAAPAAAAAVQGSPADTPLVRMRDGHGSDLLFRVNPRTLEQVGRPIRTFRNGASLGSSPSGTRIAYTDATQRRSRIHFVDLAGWRSLGVARLGNRGQLGVGWVSESRVLAHVAYGAGPQQLLWVDVRTKKIVARRAFTGFAMNTLQVPGGVAMALAPERGLGPLRIMLADANGGLRTIRLDRIEAGANYKKRGRVVTPAVTVDPDGGRLYAVAGRGLLVAEVELASGAVAYHSLGASAAKGDMDVWWRTAAWAGDSRIAVTGDHWPRPRRGKAPIGPVPFGVRIVDTTDWTIRTLDRRPDTIHVAGDTVLAAGTRFVDPRRPRHTGLLGFDETGRRAFARFRGLPVVLLGSRGRRGYVWVRRERTAYVIDLATGRTLHRTRTGRRVPFLLSPP
jgi:hypothetical protein